MVMAGTGPAVAAPASVPLAQPASAPSTASPSPPATTVPPPAGTVPPPAGTLGTVPPAKPAANCAPAWAKALTGAGALGLIDYCRAQQGIGPLRLPSNFDRLSVPEQMLVIIDLERVNRGEVPVAGLTAPLDHLAQQAAATGSDPAIGFGDIWEGGPISTAEADYGWMYDDGYAGSNTGCTAPGGAQCWGHRDIILADDVPGALVAGAGFETGLSYGNSYTLGLAGYAPGSRLVFSWAGELRYFRVAPSIEPLASSHAGQPVPVSE
ncbi:MAG: hypothetical protein ABSE77_06175 [Acidimicrobiales bacterium]